MEQADVIVIGAGVVGLGIAARISDSGKSVYVIERHDSFGCETSSRNSEVIHSGIYYPAGTLKALLCVKGNRELYEICSKNNVACRRTGKLIVATNREEAKQLECLLENGRSNGVEGLKMLSAAETEKLEPHVSVRMSLFSETTGIIDSHALMKYFMGCVRTNGGDVVFGATVLGLRKLSGGYEVAVGDRTSEVFKFQARVVINSAGLESDSIAGMVGIDVGKQNYRLKYCKGQYFRLAKTDKCRKIKHLVYPVPHEALKGLGVHATLDLRGSVRLGPDAVYIERSGVDHDVALSERKNFFRSAVKFMPFLEEDDLVPDTAGIRPKLQGEGESFRDFVIKEESDIGFPGFINLIGIESPGLTSTPAIAGYVNKMVEPVFA